MTKNSAELDLINERSGLPDVFIEIKSKTEINEKDTYTLANFKKDIPRSEFFHSQTTYTQRP